MSIEAKLVTIQRRLDVLDKQLLAMIQSTDRLVGVISTLFDRLDEIEKDIEAMSIIVPSQEPGQINNRARSKTMPD